MTYYTSKATAQALADVDEYMAAQGYDSYLVPDEFTGEVVFSQLFFEGLIT
jgi:hypothetical protein